MVDVSDSSLAEAVLDLKNDSTSTDWIAFGYKDKTKISLAGKGSGGHAELMNFLNNGKDQVYYATLRLVDGDQESRRIKFVFLTWVGENVGGLAKGRVSTHKPLVAGVVGQFHVELRVENTKEATEEIIRKKIKQAQGADYDTGSNKNGYQKNTDIKKTAMSAYSQKEKEGNIGGVVYVTTALPQTTPVDLGGRAMVAPPSDAKKNIKMLDSSKFEGKASPLPSPQPTRKSDASFDEGAVSKLSVDDERPESSNAGEAEAAADDE